MDRIGFVGLGNMGAPMSANVAKAGFPLTLFDIDRAAAPRRAAEIGADHAQAYRAWDRVAKTSTVPTR